MLFFAVVSSLLLLASCDPQGPITEDFQNWLNQNGYQDQDFARKDFLTAGSYGGKTSPTDVIKNQPVVFIHGNSDSALRHDFQMSGWSNSIEFFLSKGYQTSELYATTWGDGNAMNAQTRTHDCPTLTRMRKFLEAVIAYTNATKIDVISHSMGVTIGRKIIKGGTLKTSTGESCDLGKPLPASIDTFVGISGGNYGLCNCQGVEALFAPTCNKENGFWPGDSCGFNTMDCGLNPLPFPCSSVIYSSFLTDLNSDTTKEGSYVFAAWSTADDLIMYNDNVWGKPTSNIPTANDRKIYPSYTHMQTKELTGQDQYDMVVNHIV